MEIKPVNADNGTAYSSLKLLRICVGIVYLWFGALKFFEGLSPAEQLAMQTIHKLTFGLINDRMNLIMLASWECVLGLLLIAGKYMKPALAFLFLHMVCTFTRLYFSLRSVSPGALWFNNDGAVYYEEYCIYRSRAGIVES